MSLNNIELGNWIVSELYRDSLLATETPYISAHPLTARPSSASAETAPVPGPMPAPSSQETPLPAQAGPTPASPAPATTKPGLASLAAAVHGKSTPASGTATSTPVNPATNIPPGPNTPAGTTYKFLGTNRRHITIIVQSPGVAFLPDDQLSFLTKMLEACKMNMGDVAIVNQATTPVNITALKQQLQPATLLLFGMEPVDIRLPMNFPAFKIQEYDGCTYLYASSLQELVQPGDESKLLKSKLWICLKTIFGI